MFISKALHKNQFRLNVCFKLIATFFVFILLLNFVIFCLYIVNESPCCLNVTIGLKFIILLPCRSAWKMNQHEHDVHNKSAITYRTEDQFSLMPYLLFIFTAIYSKIFTSRFFFQFLKYIFKSK